MVTFLLIYVGVGLLMFILLARTPRDKWGTLWSPVMIFWASVFWWFAAICMIVGWFMDRDYGFTVVPIKWAIAGIRKW